MEYHSLRSRRCPVKATEERTITLPSASPLTVSAPYFFHLMFCLEPVIEIMSVNASTFEKDLVRSASNFSTRRRRHSILPGSQLG